jgi:hypothetical protein
MTSVPPGSPAVFIARSVHATIPDKNASAMNFLM